MWSIVMLSLFFFFFFQAEDGIRDLTVTGVQTCALPILGGFLSSPAPEDLMPIGKWTSMSEDSHGLQAKGRLINLDTESGKRIYGAMKENALSGLSIGYRAKDFVRGTKENEPRRTLKQVHLVEVSPVTFP